MGVLLDEAMMTASSSCNSFRSCSTAAICFRLPIMKDSLQNSEKDMLMIFHLRLRLEDLLTHYTFIEIVRPCLFVHGIIQGICLFRLFSLLEGA